MIYNAIICRYHEIAIKGNNRSFFERKLVENLHYLLRDFAPLTIQRVRGRIWIEKAQHAHFEAEEWSAIAAILKLAAFGVESFSPAVVLKPDMSVIEATLLDVADAIFLPALTQAAQEQRQLSFRVRARRSDKNFPLRSQEIEIRLTSLLGERYGDDTMKIDLSHGEVSVGVEVREEMAILYFETVHGPGGLPVGSNDKVLALLSGGIDSPVACYLTMKRGSCVDFIAFNSDPYTPPETTEKVRGIADYLNHFEKNGRLYIGNLAEVQKMIRDNCNPRFRTVLYRRMMFRIAQMVAEKRHCGALLTGESLGQVASQTVVNMGTINAATSMLVLRPLCGQDKNETIRIAEAIGTFELSKVQVPDSCTVFAPGNPATAVTMEQALEEEQKIPEYPALLEKVVAEILSAARSQTVTECGEGK